MLLAERGRPGRHDAGRGALQRHREPRVHRQQVVPPLRHHAHVLLQLTAHGAHTQSDEITAGLRENPRTINSQVTSSWE